MGGSDGDDERRDRQGVDADRFTHLCIATGKAIGGVGKPAGGEVRTKRWASRAGRTTHPTKLWSSSQPCTCGTVSNPRNTRKQ